MFKNLWHKDWSSIWGKIKLVGGSIFAASAYGVNQTSHLVNDASVKTAIDNLHLDPRIGLGIAILGAVTLISAAHD